MKTSQKLIHLINFLELEKTSYPSIIKPLISPYSKRIAELKHDVLLEVINMEKKTKFLIM
jgi:hypothetical protein